MTAGQRRLERGSRAQVPALSLLIVFLLLPGALALPNFNSSSTETTIVVSWTADPSSTLKKFEIIIGIDVKFTGDSNSLQTASSYTIQLLLPGHTYSVLVEGTKPDDSIVQLFAKTQVTNPLKPVLSHITEPNIFTTRMRVTWSPNPQSQQSNYRVEHRDLSVSGVLVKVLLASNVTEYTIDDLSPGHNYSISVLAISDTEFSQPATIYENTVPLPPTISTLTAVGTHELYLTWKPAPASMQGAFRITYEALGSNSPIEVNGCGPTYCTVMTGEDFNAGQQISIKVYAIQGRRSSRPVAKIANTKPEPVQNLRVNTARQQATSLMVLWEEPASSYTTFNVTVTPNEGTGSSPSKDGSNWMYTQNSLLSGKLYEFSVRTVSGQAHGDAMSISTYTRPPQPPSPVRDHADAVDTLVVTWGRPQATGTFDRYRVTISRPGVNPRSVVVTKSATRIARFSLLRPGAKYTVTLVTLVGSNVESLSSSSELYVKPLPPRNVTLLTQARDQLTVRWEVPSSDPANDFSGFVILINSTDVSPSRPKTLVTGSTLEATFSNLSPGTLYTVKVSTESGGVMSTPAVRHYYTKPNMPRSLRHKAVTKNSIEVEWSPPLQVGNRRGYDGYNIRLVPSGGGDALSTTELGPDETSYLFVGLFPGTEYQVQLSSYIVGTVSDPSSISIQTRPESPSYLDLVDKNTTTLTVSWDPPSNNAAVGAYLIRIIPRDQSEYSPEMELHGNRVNFTYSPLMAGRSYEVNVIVKKGVRQSEPAVLEVTMNPNPVENLRVTYQGTTSVNIQWDDPYNSNFDTFSIVVTNQSSTRIRVDTVTGQTSAYDITNLAAGERYTVTVTTLSNNQHSTSFKIDFVTSPEGVATIEPIEVKTDAVKIRWTAPNRTEFSGYELGISPNDGGIALPVTINKGQDLMYRFTSLRPGSLYNMSIAVITTHGTTSQPFYRQIGTMPSAVNNMKTEALNTNSIRVSWDVNQNSIQKKFTVSSYEVQTGSLLNVDIAFDGRSSYVADLTNLKPGERYEIAVWAVSETKGDSVVKEQATKPKAVQDIVVTSLSPFSLHVTWATAPDSRQDEYYIRYSGKYVLEQMIWKDLKVDVTETIIDDLFPGELYIIEVSARSSGVDSIPVTKSNNTYPLSPEKLAVDPMTRTSTSVRVTWVYNPDTSYVTGWLVQYAETGQSSWKESSVTASVNDMTLSLLEPGVKYTVQVFGVTNNNVRSQQPTQITITTKPMLTSALTKDANATTTDSLVIRYTENSGQFDHYMFSIDPPDSMPIQKDLGDNERRVEFRGLMPGYTYTVTVITISGDVRSQGFSQDFNTRPAKPVVKVNWGITNVTLTITKPEGVVNSYAIGCVSTQRFTTIGCSPNFQTRTVSGNSDVVVQFKGLKAYTEYRFTIWSRVASDRSMDVVKLVNTEQDAPGKVRNLTASAIEPDLVNLKWNEPLEENGIIIKYTVSYSGIRQGTTTAQKEVTVYHPWCSLENLKGGYSYTIDVRAYTVSAGDVTSTSVTTPIKAPRLASEAQLSFEKMKPRRINASEVAYDHFSVQLIDPFTDRNGQVVSYTVIVTTDPLDRMLSAIPLPYWADYVGRGIPGTYQAIDPCTTLFSPSSTCGKGSATTTMRRRRALFDTVTFVVGGEECDIERKVYCNGRVSPDTTYYVKLRGYTEEGAYTDAPLSDGIITAVAPPDESVKVLVVVIVVLVILFLVLAFAILFFLYRRGVICSKDSLDSFSRTSGATSIRISLRDSFRRRKPHADTSRPIKVADFQEHVRIMSADSDFKFSEEYEDLKPVGRDQPCLASELPCNRNKNRFTNILPYDHSRVKLLPTDDEEGTDYINANYMPGFNSKREFIVTQGPLPSTRDDFWRILWEQNCRALVMLTKCVEKGREKCDHYWPIDSEPMFYGDLQILILNETKCPEWVVTEFRISKGEQSRNIKHFHYIAWPDFGVPQRPQSLIRFVRLVRSKMSPDGGPIITHCSAGVGRSGAYIAVDHLLQNLEVRRMEKIDVFGVTYAMRLNRPQMVQTEQQYICIHHCLECVLEGKENEPSPYSGEDNDAFDDDEGITMDTN